MSDRRLRRGRFRCLGLIALVLALVGLLIPGGVVAAAGPPVLPVADWSPLLSNLDGPVLTPGTGGSITFRVTNPLSSELVAENVSLQVYGFNPTDGGAPQALPSVGAPVLGTGGQSYTVAPPVLPSSTSWNWSVPVSVPSTAPTGDYAVRFLVTFTMTNVSYRLASRGFFSDSEWAAATSYPNGTPTINASLLGVSGVVPETSILVHGASTPWALYAVLGVGLGLVAVGAYWWTRSETKSRSGTRRSSPPQSAPTAFGRSRSRDGD